MYKIWSLDPLFTSLSSRLPLLSLLSHIHSTPIPGKQRIMVLEFGPPRTRHHTVIDYSARWLLQRSGQDLIEHLPKMPMFAEDVVVGQGRPGKPSITQQMSKVKEGQAIFPKDLLNPRHQKGLLPGFPAFSNLQQVRQQPVFSFRKDYNVIDFPRFGVYTSDAVIVMCEVSWLDRRIHNASELQHFLTSFYKLVLTDEENKGLCRIRPASGVLG